MPYVFIFYINVQLMLCIYKIQYPKIIKTVTEGEVEAETDSVAFSRPNSYLARNGKPGFVSLHRQLKGSERNQCWTQPVFWSCHNTLVLGTFLSLRPPGWSTPHNCKGNVAGEEPRTRLQARPPCIASEFLTFLTMTLDA